MTTTVISGNDIPAHINVASNPEMFDLGKYVYNEAPVEKTIQVWYNDGTIRSKEVLDWTPFVHAARDRHEQNLELHRAASGRVYIRTIRFIHQGEQLLVWYSPPLALELDIPVVSIQNILGVGCYECLHCRYKSAYPNTLKAHMKFHCNNGKSMTSSKHAHWNTIAVKEEQLVEALRHNQHCCTIPDHHLEVKSCQCPKSGKSQPCKNGYGKEIYQSVKCDLTYNSYNWKKGIFMRPLFNDPINSDFYNYPGLNRKIFRTVPSSCVAPSKRPDDEQLDGFHNTLLELSSRKGHLCLYCGKFYSRKYGLKIHLRTHTGYKPLKCKICFRPFGDPSNLNKHVRLHSSGDTPYKCKHCGKVLVRKRDLLRHVKSRHLEVNKP